VTLAFLVVEDHPLAGATLRRALARHGRAELVETRATALDRIQSGEFDALVTDIGLPDGSGFDVVREARRRSPDMPVLVISGDVDRDRLREADAQRAAYLLKPPRLSDIDRFARRVRAKSAPLSVLRIERWVERYQLIPSEAEILELAASGTTRHADLAEIRGTTHNTVKKQVQQMLEKTGDDSLQACVARFLRESLTSE